MMKSIILDEFSKAHFHDEILNGLTVGVWNVPCVTSVILIKGSILKNDSTRPVFEVENLDSQTAFCLTNLKRDLFMYLNNRQASGHLVNVDSFLLRKDVLTNELYELENNRIDWEQR
jgi:hypothetical protein